MKTFSVVSDSSFYICFLGDIKKPQCLSILLQSEMFQFVMGNIIKSEIKKSSNYDMIEKVIEMNVKVLAYYCYGELIRPFFSVEEIKKGEHEVIAISFILHSLNIEFTAIIDDNSPRKFLEKRMLEGPSRITGTVGFIMMCCCNYKVFSVEDAINILEAIKKSKFRIDEEKVNEVIKKIRGCHHG